MTRTLTLAAAAYPPSRLTSLGAYRDKLATWVADAAAHNADLLVFPEYGAMEYAGASREADGDLAASLEAVAAAMPVMDAALADLARRHRLHILAPSGPTRLADGTYVNAATLFAPSGARGVQHKMIMTPFERTWGISAGATLRVFETALGVIAIAICYDSEFPLLVHAQAAAGADVILIPSCTEFVSGFHRVRTAALARALENTCVTLQAPTVGDAPWSPAIDHNCGAAGIFAPAERGMSDTGILAETVLNSPGLAIARVDLTRLADVRLAGEMRNVQDWALQPGASAARMAVERITLA